MQNNFVLTHEFLEKRNCDIDTIMSYIADGTKTIECTIFKSSVMLMLYNEVEGVYSNLLCEFFDYIIDNNIPFEKLHKKVRKLYFQYHLKKIGKSIEGLEDFYGNIDLKNVGYLEINKYLKLYSGNLDARQIRKISKELGITVSMTVKGDSLLKVKNCRNKLAHGEVSFQEACRDYSAKELKEFKSEVYDFMKMLIEDYENFIKYQLISK